jgi:hypothetical protein
MIRTLFLVLALLAVAVMPNPAHGGGGGHGGHGHHGQHNGHHRFHHFVGFFVVPYPFDPYLCDPYPCYGYPYPYLVYSPPVVVEEPPVDYQWLRGGATRGHYNLQRLRTAGRRFGNSVPASARRTVDTPAPVAGASPKSGERLALPRRSQIGSVGGAPRALQVAEPLRGREHLTAERPHVGSREVLDGLRDVLDLSLPERPGFPDG